jgi:hypothetical protein
VKVAMGGMFIAHTVTIEFVVIINSVVLLPLLFKPD